MAKIPISDVSFAPDEVLPFTSGVNVGVLLSASRGRRRTTPAF